LKPLGATDPSVVSTYRLVGVLGGGGMGRVYLGESRTGRRVAIKVIRDEIAEDPVFRRRFAREVAAAKSVNPLFTAAVVDADPDAEAPWLATTYIEGPTLTELVFTEGPLSPRAVLILAAGLAEALASIHRVGLVHRDLKPSNVIVNNSGPHIIDFGIALASETSRLTDSKVVGTPSYMAPEIIQGGEAEPAGDVFSLGATLVFAASGKHLVTDGTMYAQIMQITLGRFDLEPVPKELRPLIVRCLSPEPRDRPTADELATILVAAGITSPSPGWYTSKEPAPPLPATIDPQPERRRMSRRRVLTMGGLAGAALLGSGAGIAWNALRPEPPAQGQAAGPTPSASATPSSGASGGPPVSTRILWQAASGSIPVGQSPTNQQFGVRIIVDVRPHLITANAAEVYASDRLGTKLWTKTLPTRLVTIRPWGDAVLASDARRLWLLDAVTGDLLFTLNAADIEQQASRFDNDDKLAVEIGAIALSSQQAFIGLGTATIAINRKGERVWRMPRPESAGGRRPSAGVPRAANDTYLATHDIAGTAVQVALLDATDRSPKWSVGYDPGPQNNNPPPPPNASNGSAGAPPDESMQQPEGRFVGGYLVLRDGKAVRALRLANGSTAWSVVSATPVSGFTPAGGVVVVAAADITGYTLDTNAATIAWSVSLRGARVAASPDGRTVIAVAGQVIAAIDSSSGKQLWTTPVPEALTQVAVDRIFVDAHVAYVTFRGRPESGKPLTNDVIAVALDA
jgi:serine/threonine protein kinase/outer membrane protein assembly factor BamB